MLAEFDFGLVGGVDTYMSRSKVFGTFCRLIKQMQLARADWLKNVGQCWGVWYRESPYMTRIDQFVFEFECILYDDNVPMVLWTACNTAD